jgi:hypothetical protein
MYLKIQRRALFLQAVDISSLYDKNLTEFTLKRNLTLPRRQGTVGTALFRLMLVNANHVLT